MHQSRVRHADPDAGKGTLQPDILQEKVLSAILEFQTETTALEGILKTLEAVAHGIDTVMAVGVASRCDADGRNVLEEILPWYGYPILRAKTNLGLGRPGHPRGDATPTPSPAVEGGAAP